MQANIPDRLLHLLEKLVLYNETYMKYPKLQNLLIITAIKHSPGKVMEYINRLDKYNGEQIITIALKDEYKLYEEAYTITEKLQNHTRSVEILIKYIKDIQRASDFAERINKKEVWIILGDCYIQSQQLVLAIEAYLKANYANKFKDVIALNKQEPQYEKLIEFLTMVRKQKKLPIIDNTLIYSLAKLKNLQQVEEFINSQNSADLTGTGQILYEEDMFEAAQLLFSKAKSNKKIAMCLIHLGKYQEAIDYAKKANNINTWKEIVYACVEQQEFKLAEMAAIQVVTIPDYEDEIIHFYELHNSHNKIIALLEKILTERNAQIGIINGLFVLYAKYERDKLFDFIKINFQKLNMTKSIQACNRYKCWQELVYLHTNYKNYEEAVKIMMEHSPSVFVHEKFLNNLIWVKGDLLYQAINFYIQEEPQKLNTLLKQISNKLDFTRVVNLIDQHKMLPLVFD